MAVGEVHESAELRQGALGAQLFHVLENGAEVGAVAALHLEMRGVVFDFLRLRQHDVLLHAVVAEDEVHADPLEKVRAPAEDRCGFVEEALDLSLLGRG